MRPRDDTRAAQSAVLEAHRLAFCRRRTGLDIARSAQSQGLGGGRLPLPCGHPRLRLCQPISLLSLSPARARLTLARLAQIECSYDNSRPDELLYGHLCPRHVLAELAVLHELLEPTRSRPSGSAGAGLIDEPLSARLRGLRVHIIHVKETLEALTTDGGGIRGRVLRELEEGKQFFERGILSEVEFKVVKRGELLSASCS